jgi:hypothetical protein
MQVSRLDDSMIFFLAALPEDEYVIVKEIFNLYELCEIKDQKLSRSQRGTLMHSKLDCKGVNFKPFRGLGSITRKDLLEKVRDGDLSFSELGTSSKYIKKMANVKTQFMRYLNLTSWEMAEEMYPEHTKKENMEPFMDMSFKDNNIPTLFQAFCKQAKCSTFSRTTEDATPYSNSSALLRAGNSAALVLSYDVLQLDDKELMSSTSLHSCNGFSLTVVDPPMVCQLVGVVICRVWK